MRKEIPTGLEKHIKDMSGGIIPLERMLREEARVGHLTSPEQLDGWLASLEGPFSRGRPEALMRKLGGPHITTT